MITEKIREAHSIREIMLDLVDDICSLFNADRFTIYLITEDKAALVTKIKTGVNSFKDMRLPISEQSIAGYVALHKEMLNIRDVYDEKELASHSAHLRFLQDVDKRTNYRTRQVLVAPIVNADKKELIGVIQIINNKTNQPFTESVAKGAEKLADVLAVALSDRHREIAATRYGMLVWEGLISATNLEHVMSLAQAQGGGIEDILIDEYQITPAAIDQALSAFFCVPYQSFSEDMSRPDELLKSLKRGYLEASQWIPVEETPDGTIVILTTDPERIQVSRLVGAIFPKRKLTYRVCSQREFDDTLNLFYGEAIEAGSVDELLGALNIEAEESEAENNIANSEELNAAADNELVKLVNKIIMDAYNMGASDIHVEPMPGRKDKTGIRLRKDGSLMKYIEIPAASRNALVTRLKVMCDLDISEKRIPQDGKIKFKKFAPLDIELRVATIPTQGDVEDVVMRILASGDPIPLEKMAFSERNLQLIKQTIVKPYGLFFVCGPTGSGKTTTLHSILRYINTPDTKIWTVEDPVEITQKGLRQVQVNKKAGLDFATVMRSFLRADPDVIMVGEMRDRETVSTGIEASLTGHLVFATLHTNSAPESIVRLLDMGMDPFNFADALLGILAQRLAKRLCKDCCEPHVASPEEVDSLLQEYAEELKHTERWVKDPQGELDALRTEWVKKFANEKGEFTLYSKVGCDKCVDTGYRGRVALHELVIGTDPIKKAIQEHARVADLFAIALDEDMRTLKQDGIEKVLQGITDVHQVRAVCIK
ncbi:MAG: Flp pilus assembly complex ATPase component TadA [Gallionellaceae bacterium]|nr:Flp pilus assembly complex ATPase component TadA [Gallionellaceae bacterium]